jgi:hypothetical protein
MKMKKIRYYAVLPLAAVLMALTALTACVSNPAEVEVETETETLSTDAVLQNRYMAYLREEGYFPSIDADGDILFKIQGRSYYIIINAEDAEYFVVLYPSFWSADTAAKRRQATLAAAYATGWTKVARAYLNTSNYVSATAEVFLNDPEDYRYIFPRMLRTIDAVVDSFEEYLDR